MQPQLYFDACECVRRHQPPHAAMRRLLLVFVFLLLVAPFDADAQSADTTDVVHVPFNVSIWRGISIGDAIAGDPGVRHSISLALPYGEADRLTGVSLALFGSVYRQDVSGLQLSGLGNVAGSSTLGLQAAGLGNVSGDRLSGIQLAGLANVAGGRLRGIQLAGLANVAEGLSGIQASGLASISGDATAGFQAAGLASVAGERMFGIQASGLANIAGDDLRGWQMAGVANITGDDVRGIQTGGVANIAGDDLIGFQTAGLANIVGGTMRGVQVAAVNVAVRSTGVQIGLVNVAGKQDGLPIGLFSVAADIPVHLEIWTDETAAIQIGVRSGSATISNYFALAARPASGAEYRWAVTAGLGYQRPAGERTQWGVDLLSSAVIAENLNQVSGSLLRLRIRGMMDLGSDVSLFAGPAVNLWVSRREDGAGLAPYTLAERTGDTSLRLWPGLEAGLRISLGRPIRTAPAGT